MGAWCTVGSRPDLRHRPRHRCAVATPAFRPRRGIDGVRSATDVATSVSPTDWATTSTTSASRDRRRINDGNCPPVAHRLSRLGRNEFSDTASISIVELAPGTSRRRYPTVCDSAPWRQSSGVATPEQENTTRGNSPPSTDRSLTVTTCEFRNVRALILYYKSFGNAFIEMNYLFQMCAIKRTCLSKICDVRKDARYMRVLKDCIIEIYVSRI